MQNRRKNFSISYKKIENQISFLAHDRKKKYVRLVVSPYVAAFLRRGLWSLRMTWMCRYGVWIDIRSNQSLGIVDVRYQDRKGKNLFE